MHDDGAVTLLRSEPDLMLGVDPPGDRHDHERSLTDGDTVVRYTDGLVERRGEGLDAGLDRLVAACRGLVRLGPDKLCDAILDRMLPRGSEDDVALVVVRAQPGERR